MESSHEAHSHQRIQTLTGSGTGESGVLLQWRILPHGPAVNMVPTILSSLSGSPSSSALACMRYPMKSRVEDSVTVEHRVSSINNVYY